VTAGVSGGEALATLVTTGLEDGASRSGLHPVAEAVLLFPAAYFGLICPFHDSLRVRDRPKQATAGIHRCQSRGVRDFSPFLAKNPAQAR
jgi:hypothetical protein